MGKILQVRVMARTYDPAEVAKRWKRLYALVWPAKEPGPERGVLKLACALADLVRFGDWDEEIKKDLGPGIKRVDTIRRRLEAALADWNPSQANDLSEEIEEGLDELENLAPKPY